MCSIKPLFFRAEEKPLFSPAGRATDERAQEPSWSCWSLLAAAAAAVAAAALSSGSSASGGLTTDPCSWLSPPLPPPGAPGSSPPWVWSHAITWLSVPRRSSKRTKSRDSCWSTTPPIPPPPNSRNADCSRFVFAQVYGSQGKEARVVGSAAGIFQERGVAWGKREKKRWLQYISLDRSQHSQNFRVFGDK